MKRFVITGDNSRDIGFTGVLLAKSANMYYEPGTCIYEAYDDPYIEYTIYKSVGGFYICKRLQTSGNPYYTSSNECIIEIFSDHDTVIEFFGHTPLAKELYSLAGIDYIKEIR